MQDIPKDTLIKAAEGNMKAFEEIYQVASGFVYSVAFRITRNQNDAEEVTQDVFLKIYKKLKSFNFRASFKTWVYRITANTAINRYRKKAKETKHTADYDIALKTESSSSQTEKAIERKDAQVRLAALLDVLNPDQRACIVLREIEGLSYEEIAKALKININTVRSRLKRARLTLLGQGKRSVKDEV